MALRALLRNQPRASGALLFAFVVSAFTTAVVGAAEPSLSTPATDDEETPYFTRHAEGWFWYHDPKSVEPTTTSPPTPNASASAADDPAAELAEERRQLEEALDRAVLHPTADNVAAYLRLNQRLMNQASAFSDAWRGAVYRNPDLDHRLESPTGMAAYTKADVTSQSQDQQLGDAAHEWGLLFFFRGSCPYCHKFAPVLKLFAERYGFRLVPITLDGGGLPEFPQAQPNGGAGEALGVEGVPAVFVINPRTRTVVPAVFGLVGWSELMERVLYAIQHANDGSREAPAITAQMTAVGGNP